VGGFSFGLIFTLLALPAIALPLWAKPWDDRSGRGRRVRSTLLAFALHFQRRCGRAYLWLPFTATPKTKTVSLASAGRLLDGVAAETLAKKRSISLP